MSRKGAYLDHLLVLHLTPSLHWCPPWRCLNIGNVKEWLKLQRVPIPLPDSKTSSCLVQFNNWIQRDTLPFCRGNASRHPLKFTGYRHLGLKCKTCATVLRRKGWGTYRRSTGYNVQWMSTISLCRFFEIPCGRSFYYVSLSSDLRQPPHQICGVLGLQIGS